MSYDYLDNFGNTNNKYYGMKPIAGNMEPSYLQSALGYTSVGDKGAKIENAGIAGTAIGAFDSWNKWNQGNKMYDLQEEAFDFSKDKFWNNMAMQRDAYNRDINRKNFMNSKRRDMASNPDMTDAERNAMNAKGYTTYMNDGNAVRDLDGKESQIINIPGQYTPGSSTGASQSAFNQPSSGSPAPITTAPTTTGNSYAAAGGYGTPSTPAGTQQAKKPVRL